LFLSAASSLHIPKWKGKRSFTLRLLVPELRSDPLALSPWQRIAFGLASAATGVPGIGPSEENFYSPAGEDPIPRPADLGPGNPSRSLSLSPHYLEEKLSCGLPKEEGFAGPWGSWEGDQGLVSLEGEESKAPILS